MGIIKFSFNLLALTSIFVMPLALQAVQREAREPGRVDERGIQGRDVRGIERHDSVNPYLRGAVPYNSGSGATSALAPNNCYYDQTGAWVCV